MTGFATLRSVRAVRAHAAGLLVLSLMTILSAPPRAHAAGQATAAPRSAMSRGDTISRAAIADAVAALVVIDTVPGPNGRDAVRVVGVSIDRAGPSALLAPFLARHGRMLWYLATHTSGAGARIADPPSDPRVVRDSIVTALGTDRAFTEALTRMLAAFWAPSGRVIAGYARAPAPAALSEEQLQRIAVRFFYPDRVSATGDTLFTHVCAGINGLGDMTPAVDPVVAAFAFDAVSSAFFPPSSALMQAFERAQRRTKGVSLSADPATRVRRAQGAMWALLEQDPALVDALTVAYQRHEAVLPFRLTTMSP